MKPLVLIIALLITLGTGCTKAPQATADEWTRISDGFEVMPLQTNSSSTVGVLYAFDPKLMTMRFETSPDVKTTAEWLATQPNAIAVMNGVYFHEDGSPSGMFVHQQKEHSTRRFDHDKSSLLRLDPQPAIIDFDEVTAALQSKEAGQSYPLLIDRGEIQIRKDSGKKARRSFAAVRTDGYIILGTIAEAEVSLYELAHLLKRKPYRIKQALNMDGGPSSGLMTHLDTAPSYNSFVGIPNVIVVTKKP